MQSILTPRLVEFRRLCSARLGWNIETECLRYDESEVIFKATIKGPDGKVVATGHSCEKRYVNDAFESCESKAISRALDNVGFTEGSVLSLADEACPCTGKIQERSVATVPKENVQTHQKARASVQAQEPSLGQEPNRQSKKEQEQSRAEEAGRASQAVPNPDEARQDQPEARQDKFEEAQGTSSSGPNEEKAEQWVRENLTEWLDMPCPFAKAQGRTWRELAENQGTKIVMNGRSFPPRAYLHALENWNTCKMWQKIKARIALEVCKKESETPVVS
jgi:hypothetical protein